MAFVPFVAYSASAGSGKTFALSVRYLALLFLGESPSTILAATFTNKAAAEMRERVLKALRELETNEAVLQALVEETGLDRKEILSRRARVLRRFLSSASYIMTLDSFFLSVLRSAALEIGLQPDFATKEELDEEIEALFVEEAEKAGETATLVALSKVLQQRKVEKLTALLLHFYRNDPLLPAPPVSTSSIEAAEARVDSLRRALYEKVRASGASKTAVNNFAPTDIKTLFSKSVFEKTSLYDHRNYKKYLVTHPEMETLFLELKEALGAWARAKEAAVLRKLFVLYDSYKNVRVMRAKSQKEMSFDDLSFLTYRVMRESLSREFLYFKLDTRFKHMLLDEFQDTSTLQFLLLEPLIEEIVAGEGQGGLRSFFYVGDTKQSLYRFRGGTEALFDKVATRYGIPVEKMRTNYRSARHVVESVNRWFEGKMEGFVPQLPRPDAPEGYVSVVESESVVEEAIARIEMLRRQGVATDHIAVLVHTNKEGQILQEACRAAGIPTLLQTSSSLKYLRPVATLAAMVRYLLYGDEVAGEAFAAEAGIVLKEEDFSWFSEEMTPLEVLDRLIACYGYDKQSRNILRLLEFAADYDSLHRFVEEFDRSRIAVANHSVHGVRILTIHGSKGLEFPYVIVTDRVGGESRDRDALFFAYDDRLHIRRIFYRIKHREYFDRAYAEALAERKEAAAKDRMNLLYVALTRAATGMIVVKKPEKSVFAPLQMEEIAYGSIVPVAHTESETREIKGLRIPSYGTQEHILAQEEDYDAEAVRFGTALHYGLEMLGGCDEVSAQAAITAVTNRFGGILRREQRDDLADRIERLTKEARFARMWQDAVAIYKEKPFVYEGEFGRIDLLLEYETHWCVVDYKSTMSHRQSYETQVRHYMKAVERFVDKPVEGVLLHVGKEKIEFIDLK